MSRADWERLLISFPARREEVVLWRVGEGEESGRADKSRRSTMHSVSRLLKSALYGHQSGPKEAGAGKFRPRALPVPIGAR